MAWDAPHRSADPVTELDEQRDGLADVGPLTLAVARDQRPGSSNNCSTEVWKIGQQGTPARSTGSVELMERSSSKPPGCRPRWFQG